MMELPPEEPEPEAVENWEASLLAQVAGAAEDHEEGNCYPPVNIHIPAWEYPDEDNSTWYAPHPVADCYPDHEEGFVSLVGGVSYRFDIDQSPSFEIHNHLSQPGRCSSTESVPECGGWV